MRDFTTFTEPKLLLTNLMPSPGMTGRHRGVKARKSSKGEDLRKAGGGEEVRRQDDLPVKNFIISHKALKGSSY